mgnify:CR=1 FL=1
MAKKEAQGQHPKRPAACGATVLVLPSGTQCVDLAFRFCCSVGGGFSVWVCCCCGWLFLRGKFVPSLPPGAFLLFLAVTLEFGSSAGVWVVGADVLFCSGVQYPVLF